MHPDIQAELAKQRVADLRVAADVWRLSHAAARPRARSPRERLGKRLISIGSRLLNESVQFEQRVC
jgi:hypothetical protein